MKLPQFFGKRRKPKLFLRRIVGTSMLPTYRPGQIVIGVAPVDSLQVGDIVMVAHDGLEKIKRVAQLRATQEIYLLGDNPLASVDSREFGWLGSTTVKGKIVWPRPRKQTDYSVG